MRSEWSSNAARSRCQQFSGENAKLLLGRIRWQLFATFTFKNVPKSEAVGYKRVWRSLRDAAGVMRIPYARFLLAIRAEYGEKRGRFHFHALISHDMISNVRGAAAIIEQAWRRNVGGSIAQVRLFDSSRLGVSYILKDPVRGAKNAHELSKFGAVEQVTVSRSVLRVLRSKERISTQAVDAIRKSGVCSQGDPLPSLAKTSNKAPSMDGKRLPYKGL